MRGVRSLRSIRVRSYVLPLLLGGLALRFLIPSGFMPNSGLGTALTVSMCSTTSASETLEIPGNSAEPHCDYCTAPTMGAPLVPFAFSSPGADPERSLLPPQESQIPEAPLARAQIPRAPPHA